MTDNPVLLSTSSVYPENTAYAFDLAERLGYDGIEVMVWTDPLTQEGGALSALSALHDLPIRAIHAPTLLLAQRLWGWEPWAKIDRSVQMAEEVGADVVVIHPPFRWQREYAEGFVEGIAQRQQDTDVRLAIENMFPWRARNSEMQVYRPHWDPVAQSYQHVTLDASHASTSSLDCVDMLHRLGDRVSHVHLGDGTGSFRDEHLVPGRGNQPVDTLLRELVEQRYAGAVTLEVGTRKRSVTEREADLAEALHFARTHLGQLAPHR
jgi:sugar phosphate isomerase/epimerase